VSAKKGNHPESSIQQRPLRERIKDSLAPILASKVALVGLGLVLFWVFVAIFAPFVTTYEPNYIDPLAKDQGPSSKHILGTDHLGRDLWSRVAYGARIILTLAPLAVLIALAVGCTLGLIAGYYGGWIDEIVMRILDTMLAFPPILLYLLIIVTLGPSPISIVTAITITGAPGIGRLVRSLTLDIRTREYIASAELRDENPLYTMFVEILPNARGPIIVDAMLRIGYAVFYIGTLGFLGLGLPPPTPDWGSMVAGGRKYLFLSFWPALWPSLSIATLVVGLNLFADGLREESLRYQ
jgi:peptide/nickel transport system permease protein